MNLMIQAEACILDCQEHFGRIIENALDQAVDSIISPMDCFELLRLMQHHNLVTDQMLASTELSLLEIDEWDIVPEGQLPAGFPGPEQCYLILDAIRLSIWQELLNKGAARSEPTGSEAAVANLADYRERA